MVGSINLFVRIAEITIMNVEDLVLRCCVWYRSPSLVDGNPMKPKCYSCGGIQKSCQYYLGKQEYLKAKLLACQKLNGEKKI